MYCILKISELEHYKLIKHLYLILTLILLFQLLINVPGALNGCSGNGGIFDESFFKFFSLFGDLNLCPLTASIRLS